MKQQWDDDDIIFYLKEEVNLPVARWSALYRLVLSDGELSKAWSRAVRTI